jgi:hypothetical protein
MEIGVEEKGYELTNDEILKEYELIKQKRRLLCRIIYNREENDKKESEKKQLKLFNDG